MILAHNMEAMFTSRQLGRTNGSLSKTTEKLSSGYRINRAADDSAGLSISEKMRSQIRGLERASRNSHDGISLIQTAEGALNEIQAMLHRIRELHVQAANDVNTYEDRTAIQDEITALTDEIDTVAHNTEFNTRKLLDGSRTSPSLFITPSTLVSTLDGRTMHVSDIQDNNGLNIIYIISGHDFNTAQSPYSDATISGYDNLKEVLQKEIVPQAVKSLVSTFNDAFGYLAGSSIGIGLELYSDPSSHTMASVSLGTKYLGNNIVSDFSLYSLSVNLGYLALDSNGDIIDDNDNTHGRSSLETTIIHEMMHAMMDEVVSCGMAGVRDGVNDNSNAFPLWFMEGMAQAACGAGGPYSNWISSLNINSSSSAQDISAALTSPDARLSSGTDKSNYATGYMACMYLGYLKNGSSGTSPAAIAEGLDQILLEIRDGSNLNTVIHDLTGYVDAADFANNFGTVPIPFFNTLLSSIGGNGLGGVATGDYSTIDPLVNSPYSTNLFNLDTSSTYIQNIYPDGTPKFTDGGLGGTGSASGSGIAGGDFPGGTIDITTHNNSGLWIQCGANSNQGIMLSIGNMTSQALSINNLSVLSQSQATNGIATVDAALNRVSAERSRLGAYQNRLEYAYSVADNSGENLQYAESRIHDADMADEMTRYAKDSILSQAGMSMLTQANRSKDGVLRLLQ